MDYNFTLEHTNVNVKDLKNAGLKITTPRLKILKVLTSSKKHHMSADNIYQALNKYKKEVSITTIYRVLTQFEKSGIVKKLNFNNGQSVFELSNIEHHDHLICIKCGKIIEFADEVIEQHQIDIAKKYNYKLTDHSLHLYGLCENCQ